MKSEEYAYKTAAELASYIRSRVVSPVEVMDAAIARIEARNPSLNALVFLDVEGARKEAKRAEEAVIRGEKLVPLHGVPAALKDLVDFKPGWPTTLGGVRALKDNIASFYCPFAHRMEQGGAILVGKTNSHLMGLGAVCDNYLFGPTRNPFDLSRNSGGSSGGSGAAVADGMLPIAEGTDAGGSTRIPAAWCNAYGFKASFGRTPVVTIPNAFAGTIPFIGEGPITRTVEDAALALSVHAGYEPRDPFSLDDTVDFLGALKTSIRGWKIAYSADLDVFPVDPRVLRVVEEALKTFEEAGAVVEPVKLGISHSHGELSDAWFRLMMPLTLGTIEAMKLDPFDKHRADFTEEQLRWIEIGMRQTVTELRRDQVIRSDFYYAFQRVFQDYDLLVTPTAAALPVKNRDDGETVGPSEINGETVDPLIGWCLTYPVNFTGHPAASIPAGLADGLPVGLQIIGRRYADADVVGASAEFERRRPWTHYYEICAKRPL